MIAGASLDAGLVQKINQQLRRQYSPRRVPDRIIHTPDIPLTLTGKKMEIAVRKILMGTPVDQAANRNAMANPGSLDFFLQYAKTQSDYNLEQPAPVTGGKATVDLEDQHGR